MLRALRARPWLIAAAAAVVVGMPAAAMTVLAGGGSEGAGSAASAADRAAGSGRDVDRLIAQRRAGGSQAVEPSVGAPAQVVVQTETATDFPPPAKGKGDEGGRISPGAPSDAEIRAQLRSLKREQKRVERALLLSGAPIRQGSGAFIWPVNGPITSPFCERRSWESCHPGIDIGVGTGTPIRAASAGQVALAGPQGGYGNFTCIAHSKALSTCYAHQSRIMVSVGQVVRQGQVIGLVGCTGLCFGAHLHFEVRRNGHVVSPMDYL